MTRRARIRAESHSLDQLNSLQLLAHYSLVTPRAESHSLDQLNSLFRNP